MQTKIAAADDTFIYDHPDSWYITSYEYDDYGRKIQQVEDVDGLALLTTYVYDHQNQLVKTTYPDGRWHKQIRNGRGLVAKTIERYRKEDPVKPEDKMADVIEEQTQTRVVTAIRPNHVWHVDLTCMPTGGGFWVPWLPQALIQVWPFCWWMAVVVDHYSRRVMGFAVFKKQPTSIAIRQFIGRCIANAGNTPKYLVCDKGVQFWNEGFKRWCRCKTIKPRYGAIGKHGSIAIIERFIRSLKHEYLNRLLIPLRRDTMRREIACYADWYNEHRPHQALNGATPLEMYEGVTAANHKPRYEPRRQWPSDAPCAAPYAPPKPEQGQHLTLIIRFADRHKKLPVIELREAA